MMVLVLSAIIAVLSVWLFCTIQKSHKIEKELEEEIYSRAGRDTLLFENESREQILRRALEDLADAEIDRARFVLKVVYGDD